MAAMERLLDIMAALRDPDDGCPWDVEQTYATIVPYTLEEAYEVADAVDKDDRQALRDELGDLLFQVVFLSRIAEEEGAFDFADVAAAISDKLTRRHPHVFGTAEERAAGPVAGSWERIKAEERAGPAGGGEPSAIDGIASTLPALKKAAKLGQRASRVGFDWPDADGVREKVGEELAELDAALRQSDRTAIAEELGDLLFSVANLGRHLGVEAEQALEAGNRKFSRRFRGMEKAAAARQRRLDALTLDELERLWRQQKRS